MIETLPPPQEVPESQVPQVELSLQHIPEMDEGSHLRLQKIDPETGKPIPGIQPLEGLLSRGGVIPKTEPPIKVGQRVYLADPKGEKTPDETSEVAEIHYMNDFAYWIRTAKSTYRVTKILSVPKIDADPTDKITSEMLLGNGAKKKAWSILNWF